MCGVTFPMIVPDPGRWSARIRDGPISGATGMAYPLWSNGSRHACQPPCARNCHGLGTKPSSPTAPFHCLGRGDQCQQRHRVFRRVKRSRRPRRMGSPYKMQGFRGSSMKPAFSESPFKPEGGGMIPIGKRRNIRVCLAEGQRDIGSKAIAKDDPIAFDRQGRANTGFIRRRGARPVHSLPFQMKPGGQGDPPTRIKGSEHRQPHPVVVIGKGACLSLCKCQ